jgi:creatinine amidohydrolase
MRIAEMDWRMVEDWVRRDDRAVLPIGGTEQHGGLSLATDAILAEYVAVQAAEPLGIPVFPALPFGLAPGYSAFPGTVTLRLKTFAAVLTDVLDSLKRSGFRRVLLVNGPAGNHPAAAAAQEWMMDNPDARVRVHDWWAAPRVTERISAIDPVAGHARCSTPGEARFAGGR